MKTRQAALCLGLLLLLPASAAAGADANAEYVELTPAPMPTQATGAIKLPSADPGSFATVPPETQRWPMPAVAAPAQEGGTVPLLSAPDERAGVVMTYYAGARVTVLREAKPGFVQVQTGTKDAGAMGYMRRSDLRIGSAALREVTPEYTMIELNREATVYAWCDTGAQVIGSFAAGERFYTVGKNDGKWVQIVAPESSVVRRADAWDWQVPETQGTRTDGRTGVTSGFVLMETGLGRGYSCIAERWEVEPAPGEITREQAVETAVQTLLRFTLPEGLGTAAALRAQEPQALWLYSRTDTGYVRLTVEVTVPLAGLTVGRVSLDPGGAPVLASVEEDGYVVEQEVYTR